MFIIFEGLDKVGKTTLEWELLKATDFKEIVIDRGPVGYFVFDSVFNRHTENGDKHFKEAIELVNSSDCFFIIYCYCSEETARKRLEEFKESCPYNYLEAQKLYLEALKEYRQDKVFMLDTTSKTKAECTEEILQALKAWQNSSQD